MIKIKNEPEVIRQNNDQNHIKAHTHIGGTNNTRP